MRATATRSAVAGRRGFDEDLVGAQLLHFVKNAAIGGHDKRLVGQVLRRCDQLAGRANSVCQVDDRLRRLRVNQNGRIRVQRFHVFKLLGLELFMDNARTVPQQHIGTRLTLDVAPQVFVRPPDNRLAVIHQAFDDFQRTA